MTRLLAVLALGLSLAGCALPGSRDPVPPPLTAPGSPPVQDPLDPLPAESRLPPTRLEPGAPPAADPAPPSGATDENTDRARDAALRFFPGAAEVLPRTLELEGRRGQAAARILGEPLAREDLQTPALVALSDEGRLLGVIWQTKAPLPQGQAVVIVGMDPEGRITDVEIEGAREAGLRDPEYLSQFDGRTLDDLTEEEVAPPPGQEEASRRFLASVRRAAVVLREGLIGDPQV